MREITNVPTNYAVTREQKRYIAKQNMKKAGKKKFCKHSYTSNINPYTGKSIGSNIESSYFAKHWREYVEVSE